MKGCSKVLKTYTALRSHIKNAHITRFKCPNCHQQFTRKNNLDKHLINIHKQNHHNGDNAFVCFKNKCGKVFTGNSAKYKLKKHYKVKHGLNFACSHEHCSKIYKYKWNLNRHMNDHDESVE